MAMSKKTLSTISSFLSILLLVSLSASSQVTDTIKNIDSLIYETVDTAASFPGGKAAWDKFAGKNINAFVPVENSAKKGTYKVKIGFTVMKDGSLRDFERITKHMHGMEEEVIRVLKLSPRWIPGRKDGNMVNSKASQEFTFVVMVF